MSAPSPLDKIAWRAREYRERTRLWLAEHGWIDGGTDYRPFILLCDTRTGSTMLSSFLSSHPHALMFAELFRADLFDHAPFDRPGFRRRSRDPDVVERRRTDPVAFLERDVFTTYPAAMNAVGFKLIYSHGRSERMWWDDPDDDFRWNPGRRVWWEAESDLWAHLKQRTDVAVVHLTRENLLRRVLSSVMAKQTGRWGAGVTGGVADAQDERPAVRIDPELCRSEFEVYTRKVDEANDWFADHDVLSLTYEGVLADRTAKLRRLQTFLGLEPLPLQTQTQKQEKRPLHEAIANYDELRRHFEDTPWSRFFASPVPTPSPEDTAA